MSARTTFHVCIDIQRLHGKIITRTEFCACDATEHLLGSSGSYAVEAHEKCGAKAAQDIEELVSEVTGLFAGGELSEESPEGAMKALNDAYWIAKEKYRRYAPMSWGITSFTVTLQKILGPIEHRSNFLK